MNGRRNSRFSCSATSYRSFAGKSARRGSSPHDRLLLTALSRLAVANGTPYGLSAGVVSNDLTAITRCIQELRCGTVNINETPGYRSELTPFGGVKASGLGVKEGVIEAIRGMTNVKLFTLP